MRQRNRVKRRQRRGILDSRRLVDILNKADDDENLSVKEVADISTHSWTKLKTRLINHGVDYFGTSAIDKLLSKYKMDPLVHTREVLVKDKREMVSRLLCEADQKKLHDQDKKDKDK